MPFPVPILLILLFVLLFPPPPPPPTPLRPPASRFLAYHQSSPLLTYQKSLRDRHSQPRRQRNVPLPEPKVEVPERKEAGAVLVADRHVSMIAA